MTTRMTPALITASLMTIAGSAQAADEGKAKSADARSVIQSWPMDAKKAAETTMQKYGWFPSQLDQRCR